MKIITIKPFLGFSSVTAADPDPGSGAFLTPESGIQNRFFRIPDHKPIFLEVW
jgi:hypothetical protein